ncbi:hypothetical protein Pla108_19030 [Botrimarina colliarenosi]|uniref:Carboxypeptidase regulatory-like domain-containing protein n=1 Tax=Botrimarina colliarenosi TaxID=2528001 RepID=A0A5C6AFA9_9BACT|nr:hypothetical protein [Botrimarina colliarenosi]TWT97751.1 hypothetical protein Pla108_19030 [Botrimarina colliarenosi]
MKRLSVADGVILSVRGFHTTWRLLTLGVTIVAATGCGGSAAKLSGTVSLDGETIQAQDGFRGTVMFEPTSDGGAPATGVVDESGHYEAMTGAERGLMPGDYAVAVSIVKVTPPRSEGEMPSAQRISPMSYSSSRTSGLSVSVRAGSNNYDIAIDTEQGKNEG